jgi:NADH-quinone oxidoreductase subunit J
MPSLDVILFFLFAALAVLSAFGVVFSKNTVYSALSLLMNFCMLAAVYVLMSAQFIAAVQIIVYAGAIVVLILFVVMLLGAELGESIPTWVMPKTAVGVLLGFGLLTVTGAATLQHVQGTNPTPDMLVEWGTVTAVGLSLFTDYVLPFQLTGILLTIGIVGVVVLSNWTKEEEEAQQ